MSQPAILVEHISKRYMLGLTHARSVRELVNGGVRRLMGRRRTEGPYTHAAGSHPSQVDGESFWALRDLSVEIQPGEVVGFIGKNGAGKSTLLKILSRITLPTEGRATIRGRVASLLEVGTGFHPELTGRDNVYLNGTVLGMTRAQVTRQFDSIVDFAGVETYIDTPVKRYSSGMTVRLGFAVAAHLQPEVLIIDEVLAVGDADFQQKCLGKMSDMRGDGRTVIFVSHNMAAVEQLTDRCFVLSAGECVFNGASADAIDAYLERHKSVEAASTDVSKLPRVSWAGDRAVELVTAEWAGVSDGRLGAGEDIRIRLGVRAHDDIGAYVFGVTLNWRDGTPVGSAFSTTCQRIRASEERLHELSLQDPGLAPGHYWLTIGVLRGNHEVVDVVHEVLHFDVVAPDRLPAGIIEWNPAWGRLHLQMQCAVREGPTVVEAADGHP